MLDLPNEQDNIESIQFYSDLSLQQKQWVYFNTNTYDQIIYFLVEKQWDYESKLFAKELIDTSIQLEINVIDVWFNDYENFRNQMSNSERAIFDNILPNRQMWYMVAAYKAKEKSEELFTSGFRNGKADAYRHTLWNALSTLLIGSSLTEQLTTAHEDKPPTYIYTTKENQMDYYNNNKGRNIGLVSSFLTVYDNVNNYLTLGYLRYLNNLDSSSLATINSILIPTDQ